MKDKPRILNTDEIYTLMLATVQNSATVTPNLQCTIARFLDYTNGPRITVESPDQISKKLFGSKNK